MLTAGGIVALVADFAQALKALVDAVQLLLELRVFAMQPLLPGCALFLRRPVDRVFVDICKERSWHRPQAHPGPRCGGLTNPAWINIHKGRAENTGVSCSEPEVGQLLAIHQRKALQGAWTFSKDGGDRQERAEAALGT